MTNLRHTEDDINSSPKYPYNNLRDSSGLNDYFPQNDRMIVIFDVNNNNYKFDNIMPTVKSSAK